MTEMQNKSNYQFLVFLLFGFQSVGENVINIIKYGGYSTRLCLNFSKSYIHTDEKNYLECNNTNQTCGNKYMYMCRFQCGFPTNQKISIDRKTYVINWTDHITFTFKNMKSKNIFIDDILVFGSNGPHLSILMEEEIKIEFSGNISCLWINISKENIFCKIISSDEGMTITNTSISIKYGLNCSNFQHFGIYTIIKNPKPLKIHYLWIGAILILILFICFLIWMFIFKNNKTKRKANAAVVVHQKELEDVLSKCTKAQKKAFLEYQNAIDSFGGLGELTPRHFLSFKDYTSRIFNVELKTKSKEDHNSQVKDFQLKLLNQLNLIEWIDMIEKLSKGQERSLISSLLTIVLFQHPEYFLSIMKTLLKKSVSQLKIISEEKLLFRKSDTIIEKLVGCWISLCMYENLRTGEIGKRFFNLCRAIKCKIDTGLVDFYTMNAKYALTFDHILLGEPDYEVLKINSTVNINLKPIDPEQKSLHIYLEYIEVDVLSLDSISQVKDKILEKSIMVYTEREEYSSINGESLAIRQADHNELNLYFVNNTIKLLLDDYDSTNVKFYMDTEYIIVNTMKHYNMKNGMKFLLSSLGIDDITCTQKISEQYQFARQVHLQIPASVNFNNNDRKFQNLKENFPKIPIQPMLDDMNKEHYLMRLLAVKKSLLPFIDGFFQYLLNWKSDEYVRSSFNSLFVSNSESQETENLLGTASNYNSSVIISEDQEFKRSYLMCIYYLFSIIDDVAESSLVTNKTIVKIWKSNSLILRFWVNLIKNPNFIFSINTTEPIYESLTTIAAALMESCSVDSKNIDTNSPIVKQLFLEDVKDKYSHWWQSFINSSYPVNEADIISLMSKVIEKNQMSNYYQTSLRSLESITRTLEIKFSMKIFKNPE